MLARNSSNKFCAKGPSSTAKKAGGGGGEGAVSVGVAAGISVGAAVGISVSVGVGISVGVGVSVFIWVVSGGGLGLAQNCCLTLTKKSLKTFEEWGAGMLSSRGRGGAEGSAGDNWGGGLDSWRFSGEGSSGGESGGLVWESFSRRWKVRLEMAKP